MPALPPTIALAPEIAGVLIGDMHGAAFAAAVAGFLAEQFGEHFVHRCALGEAMAVAAVGAGNVIIPAQRFTHAHGNRFFADIEMSQTRHLGAEIKLVDLLFEQTDL